MQFFHNNNFNVFNTIHLTTHSRVVSMLIYNSFWGCLKFVTHIVTFWGAMLVCNAIFSCHEQLKKWCCHSVSPCVCSSILFSFLLVSFDFLAQACGIPVVAVRAVECWQWRSGHYFHPYFPFFFPPFFFFSPRFFSSVATFSHRRSARIKKLI